MCPPCSSSFLAGKEEFLLETKGIPPPYSHVISTKSFPVLEHSLKVVPCLAEVFLRVCKVFMTVEVTAKFSC